MSSTGMEWGAKARELSSIMQSGDQLKKKSGTAMGKWRKVAGENLRERG